MWSVIAKAACELYNICPPWKEYKKARYLLGVHMLPRVDPNYDQQGSCTQQNKKDTRESHTYLPMCTSASETQHGGPENTPF